MAGWFVTDLVAVVDTCSLDAFPGSPAGGVWPEAELDGSVMSQSLVYLRFLSRRFFAKQAFSGHLFSVKLTFRDDGTAGFTLFGPEKAPEVNNLTAKL